MNCPTLIRTLKISVLALLFSGAVFSQDSDSGRIQQLEAEVANLKKLLKDAVTKQEAGRQKENEAEPAMEKSELVSGSRLRYYSVSPASYQTVQKGDAIEAGFIDGGNNFAVGNFLATDASKMFEKKHVGVLWDGYLQIEESGTHIFAAQAYRSPYFHSFLSVSINGKRLIATTNAFEPEVATIEIESPGIYFVEIWLSPSGTFVNTQNKVTAEVKFKSSKSSKFETISPGSLYTEKGKP